MPANSQWWKMLWKTCHINFTLCDMFFIASTTSTSLLALADPSCMQIFYVLFYIFYKVEQQAVHLIISDTPAYINHTEPAWICALGVEQSADYVVRINTYLRQKLLWHHCPSNQKTVMLKNCFGYFDNIV